MNLNKFINKKPFFISGPCSAESEIQILKTANILKDKIDVFRAGIWKPRTKPNCFEGMGKEALPWLQKVKKEYGLKVITEVATANHVDLCLKADIDMIWIGARTTVNPFYVQEIAEALRGVDLPVFVKNPIHPELSLWIGALERLNNKGITNLAAIHRGFYTYESSAYRNDPKWELPIELKRNLPDLPIICDPSHIAGNRNLIEDISQTAMDLDMNGLMIESHFNPIEALSDINQQLKAEELSTLLNNLVYRKRKSEDKEIIEDLSILRKKIDLIDEGIVSELKNRKQFVEEIAKLKLKHDVTIFQLERWFYILDSRKQQALEIGLDSKMISDIYKLIHKYSILTQSKIMRED